MGLRAGCGAGELRVSIVAMNTAQLLWGVLFGALGAGYALYGRRQRALVPLISGIALMVFPYFVTNTWLMVIVGAALSAAPFFIKL